MPIFVRTNDPLLLKALEKVAEELKKSARLKKMPKMWESIYAEE